MTSVADVIDRLESRSAKHDMTPQDLLEKMPPSIVDDHQEVNEWLDSKHISHIKPVSTHPHLKNDPDNWVWEDPSPNMSRGNSEMTTAELVNNELDNQLDASIIDGNPYDSPESDWIDVLVANDIPLDLVSQPYFGIF